MTHLCDSTIYLEYMKKNAQLYIMCLLSPKSRLCFRLCWFVCLFVFKQHCSKIIDKLQWLFMEGAGVVRNNKWVNFGGNPDHHADCPIRNLAITQQMDQILMKFSGSLYNHVWNKGLYFWGDLNHHACWLFKLQIWAVWGLMSWLSGGLRSVSALVLKLSLDS